MNTFNEGITGAMAGKKTALQRLADAERQAAKRFVAWVKGEYPHKAPENLAAELGLQPRQAKNLLSGRVLPKIGHLYRFAAGKATRGAEFLHHVLVEPFAEMERRESRVAKRVSAAAKGTMRIVCKLAHREYRGTA